MTKGVRAGDGSEIEEMPVMHEALKHRGAWDISNNSPNEAAGKVSKGHVY